MEKVEFLNNVKEYIKLFSFYLNNKSLKDYKIDDKKLSFFLKLSKYHSLKALFYLVIKDKNIQPEILKKLEDYYLLTLRKDVLFEKERNELFKYLNDH